MMIQVLFMIDSDLMAAVAAAPGPARAFTTMMIISELAGGNISKLPIA